MTENEFDIAWKEGYIYAVDITLKLDTETYDEFIIRAKRDNLGKWIGGKK